MKRIMYMLLFLVLSLISFKSNSQFVVGMHGAANSTWILNKQVFDEGLEMDVDVSFGKYFGFVGAYYFTDNIGLEMNFNYNTINQKYLGSIKYLLSENRNTYTSLVKYNAFDVPLLLKFGHSSYFEIGGVYQIVNKVTYTRTFEQTANIGTYKSYPYTFSNVSEIGVKNNFKNNGIGIAFGFGVNMNLINDVLYLNFGFRANYILTNMQGINALGFNKESNYVTDSEKPNFKSNPLYGGLKFGLVYVIE